MELWPTAAPLLCGWKSSSSAAADDGAFFGLGIGDWGLGLGARGLGIWDSRSVHLMCAALGMCNVITFMIVQVFRNARRWLAHRSVAIHRSIAFGWIRCSCTIFSLVNRSCRCDFYVPLKCFSSSCCLCCFAALLFLVVYQRCGC